MERSEPHRGVEGRQSASQVLWRGCLRTGLIVMVCSAAAGCSTIRRVAIREAGDALAGGGKAFAADDDPEFIRLAAPSNLKMIEALLEEAPDHPGLLLAAASGFTQYAYAFLEQDGDELETDDIAAAQDQWRRARAMYLRARDYGLRGLEVARPGFTAGLEADPLRAAAQADRNQVPLLYWTACAWGGAIALSKGEPELIADLPRVEALIDRAYSLDPTYDHGAIHQFLIAFEWVRVDGEVDPAARSRYHLERAVALSDGELASPWVSFAESVSVKQQDREEFEALLKRALAIDPDARHEWRLVNRVMLQRARRLLTRTDELFLDLDASATGKEIEP
jgi:predicted anti-sigma-YlaC factor YlaD